MKTFWQFAWGAGMVSLIGAGLAIPVIAAAGALQERTEPTPAHSVLVAAAEAATVGSGSGTVSAVVTVEADGDADGDADGFLNSLETACGSDPSLASSIPERVDGIFAGVDDDGDTQIDEALPSPGSDDFDCDGDGYAGSAEDHVYSYVPQTDGDQKTCQEYDLTHPNPGTTNKPSLRWPADLNNAGPPLVSFNKITILDLTSFIVPVKYLDTDVGDSPDDVRWDLVPGDPSGILGFEINIQDLTALIVGTTARPPMLGGARIFDGPECPWAP